MIIWWWRTGYETSQQVGTRLTQNQKWKDREVFWTYIGFIDVSLEKFN